MSKDKTKKEEINNDWVQVQPVPLPEYQPTPTYFNRVTKTFEDVGTGVSAIGQVYSIKPDETPQETFNTPKGTDHERVYDLCDIVEEFEKNGKVSPMSTPFSRSLSNGEIDSE